MASSLSGRLLLLCWLGESSLLHSSSVRDSRMRMRDFRDSIYEIEEGSEASMIEPKRRCTHEEEAARHCWHEGISREHWTGCQNCARKQIQILAFCFRRQQRSHACDCSVDMLIGNQHILATPLSRPLLQTQPRRSRC
jgi:hypothetical protein